MLRVALFACVAFVLSLAACEFVRRWSIRRALLDRPNERSLHTVPVPRLGGTGIVAAMVLVWGGWALTSSTADGAAKHQRWLLPLALVVAGLGLVDDVRPLSARLRFLVQLLAAGALVALVGTPNALDLADGISVPVPIAVLSALAVIWVSGLLNIYNFMDGMDGLAGAQGVAASFGLAVLFTNAGAHDLAAIALLLGASTAGFLAQNVPPARIFMGDAGSTFLGYLFGALVLIGASRGVRVTESALVLAPFLLDGTFTILRRASKREPIWKAHRTHLYQRAVATGLTHRDVLLVYLGWMATSVFAAVVASRVVSLGWGLALGGLAAVIVWVRKLEARAVGQDRRN